jgi:hypothetical protein
VYKAFIYFVVRDKPKPMPHGQFRARLAWAFLTLGKAPYPGDGPSAAAAAAASSSSAPFQTPGIVPETPLPGGTHTYSPIKGTSGKACAYCGSPAYQKCTSCEAALGFPYFVCGARTKRGTQCMEAHARGDECSHGSFNMTSPARRSMKTEAARRKAGRAEFGNSDSDSDPSPPSGGTRAAKNARHEVKTAQEKAAAADDAAHHRTARAAKRGIDRE